jgi:hypothetical protein
MKPFFAWCNTIIDRLYPGLKQEQTLAGPGSTITTTVEGLDLATVIGVARTRASDREFLITDPHLRTGSIVTGLKTPNESFQRLCWAAFTMNMSSNEQPLSCQISFLRITA